MDSNPESTLPWHFLSSIPCLIAGKDVSGGSDTRNLIEDFDKLSNSGTILNAFDPDQPTDNDGGFFSYVRDIGEVAGKAHYTWKAPWPKDLPLQLRSDVSKPPGSKAEDLYLSPDGLMVPWPLYGDTGGSIDRNLKNALNSQTGQKYPPKPQSVPAKGLWVYAFMEAVDSAISPDWPTTRAMFQKYAEVNGTFDDAKAREWIVGKAMGQSDPPDPPPSLEDSPYPPSLTVHVDTGRYTTETQWEVRAGKAGKFLHLEMGWKKRPGGKENPDWTEQPGRVGLKLLVDKWPCGAFQGF